MLNADERRCKAETKRGQCRVTRGLSAAGLCSMHAGTTDPREVGRASARARSRPHPERAHESLWAFLRREVAPAEIWRALQPALEGNSESARVAASRVLLDALHEPERPA